MINGRRKCSECGHMYHSALSNCPECNTSEMFSDLIPFDGRDWVYDIETFKNCFTAAFIHARSGTRRLFEISDRTNDIALLCEFLTMLRDAGCRMVGYNNVNFDYPVIHYIYNNQLGMTYDYIYQKGQDIITSDDRWGHIIWDSDMIVPQIDLFKIHHFDNVARSTSLKMLEFNMRSESIEDLPYDPHTALTPDQIPNLVEYNWADVEETLKFYAESIDRIEFREELSAKYNRNFMNHNDTKIGKDYFIMELERLMPGSCYDRSSGVKAPRQTWRDVIDLGQVILPYVSFERPEFQRILNWFRTQVIKGTKGVFNDVSAELDGFSYDFGLGGIHGSVESTTVRSDDQYEIWDWDVASYYPNLAIANRLYPEHLSENFCTIYEDVYKQRKQHKKGTAENAMLKLALNGVYGDSNNKYSPFYDPAYTMSITINGQLLLCMLAEQLIKTPGLTMVQINTDGLTVKCPKVYIEHMKTVCKWWENLTRLELESAVYERMHIRDVNNYVAVYQDGKVKRKGAYEYELDWHQNFSQLVVPKAAEAYLLHGTPVDQFIRNHRDPHDFMLRTKIPRSDQLMFNQTQPLQRITRYYVSTDGGSLTKVAPPKAGCTVGQWKRANGLTDHFYNNVINELQAGGPHNGDVDILGLPWDERINTKNKSKYEIRITGIAVGKVVSVCNDMQDFTWDNVDFDYYIEQTMKLIRPVLVSKDVN